MAQTIKLKRSATAGNTPTTSQLALGELGINTTDGKLFLKKSVSGTESVVEVGSGDSLPLSGGTLTGNLSLGDNVKLQLGNQTDGDLQIYHDGSNSYITDVGTGSLIIDGSTSTQIKGSTYVILRSSAGENMAVGNANGAFDLFYNGSKKFATNSSGILVTGSVVADGLTVDGNVKIDGSSDLRYRIYNSGTFKAGLQVATTAGDMIAESQVGDFAIRSQGNLLFSANGNAQRLKINSSGIDVTGTVAADEADIGEFSTSTNVFQGNLGGTGARLRAIVSSYSNPTFSFDNDTDTGMYTAGANTLNFTTGGVQRIRLDSAGDISFYNGSGNQGLFWDSSASSLGIGTTATNTLHGSYYGTTKLHIDGGTDRGQLIIQGDSLAQIVMSDNGATANSRVFITQVNDGVMNLKSVNDNGTSKATIMSMTSAGATTFSGSVTAPTLQTSSGNIVITGQEIYSNSEYSGNDGAVRINRFGYQGGQTKFRDVNIYDGKGTSILTVDGSTANVNIPNGKLGVGFTTVPSAPLHVVGSGRFDNSASTSVRLHINNSGSNDYASIYADTATAYKNLVLNPSGGSLLVGTTGSPSGTVEGIKAASNGVFSAAAAGTAPIVLYRHDSDGNIVNFHKDGTAVGSIGSQYRGASGDSLYFVAGDTGIIASPSDDSIVPVTTNGAGRDAAINLGTSSTRFKDLYLSSKTLYQAVGGNQHSIGVDANDLIIRSETAGSETARFTYGGNLHIGHTGATAPWAMSGTQHGVTVQNGAFIGAARQDAEPLLLNRTNSDGAILNFRKDGTTVGSIASDGGSNLIVKGQGNNAALLFNHTNARIEPYTNSVTDLGRSAAKFKDLYLSGKVTAADIYNAAGGHVIDLNNTDSTIINDPDNHSCLLLSGGDYDTNYYSNDTHYFRGRDALDIHAIIDTTGIKSLGDYKVGSQTVIDASRNLTISEDLNFSTNGYADISNTGTGAIRFKPSSQTLALTLAGANATFAGTISSGAITSSGNLETATLLKFTASLTNSWSAPIIFRESAHLALSDYSGVKLGGYNGTSYGPRFHVNGNGNVDILEGDLRIGTTTVIDASRAITNCTGISLTGGSISSYGSVTAGLGSFLVGTRGKMGQVSNDLFVCSTTADHSGLRFANGAIHPTDNTGAQSDSAQIDLGAGSYRFNDIYARNSTILTSDRNEKQDIEELSDAEQRVAVRAKGLIRKFKWKDAVVEKGDDARIHFGIVAQDLQAAFAAEGLDAGDYGVFISNTWTNEDGHEQTRMGVRYGELLAFIISAI